MQPDNRYDIQNNERGREYMTVPFSVNARKVTTLLVAIWWVTLSMASAQAPTQEPKAADPKTAQETPVDVDSDSDGIMDQADDCPYDPTRLFAENWENGINPRKWQLFGKNKAQVLKGQGRDGSFGFDPNGTATERSGVRSNKTFTLAQRPAVGFWAKGQSSKAYWQLLQVGWWLPLTDPPAAETPVDFAAVPDPVGNKPLVTLTIIPENKTEKFRYCVADECVEKPWVDTQHDRLWMYYQIRINPNLTVSFYRDGSLEWTSRQRLDPQANPEVNLKVAGQSNQAVQALDDLVVDLPTEEQPASGNWRHWQEPSGCRTKEEKPFASFYTSNSNWSEGVLDFDFKVTAQREDHAPATFYARDEDQLKADGYRVKVAVGPTGLKVEQWRDEVHSVLGTINFSFQPTTTYRCVIDGRKGIAKIYAGNVLKATSLPAPGHVEANSLGAGQGVLLSWTRPEDRDVKGVRIYRSTHPDEKGELLADNLESLFYTDETVKDQAVFYTICVIDRTGNESDRAAKVYVATKKIGTVVAQEPGAQRQLLEPPKVKGKGLQLVTVPLLIDNAVTYNPLAPYNSHGNYVMTWNPVNANWEQVSSIEPGKSYFIWGNGKDVRDIAGTPLPRKPFEVTLHKGWNMVGNPFLSPVRLDALRISCDGTEVSLANADARGWVAGELFVLENTDWQVISIRDSDAALPTWKGVYLLADKECRLSVPPAQRP